MNDRDPGDETTPCRWCKSVDCTPATSPHCYCLDCEEPLEPCRCRPDCTGGNCYQPCCSGDLVGTFLRQRSSVLTVST